MTTFHNPIGNHYITFHTHNIYKFNLVLNYVINIMHYSFIR
ncbi:hypothetical protein F383_17185 [Gossypium arboreum]|uniref:Uncharacterized protein n=1 Tax=Gossypium arboreum TaxID=29729 RepID=A0A0B0NNW5_GOSAR|nr:hypothetical protein F383_17185 [Gossypium arboreum]